MTLKAFMVVAQLVVQSLQTPEVRPSIPVIDKLYTVNWIEKTKKRPGMALEKRKH